MQNLKKPEWIRTRTPSGEEYARMKAILRRYNLNTVCESALCPNLSGCWNSGTATIMILGDTCSRACRFCAVRSGDPGGKIDLDEPRRVGLAVRRLGLKYVVITSVTRDDIPDGGAFIYAETVREIKKNNKDIVVEILIPDFNNSIESIRMIVESEPEVISHNVETVERLTPLVRDPRAGYWKSLKTLKIAKEINPEIYTKSSIMLGLGETREEVIRTMMDLRNVGVDFLTLGQYLRPTQKHIPVVEYITPETFNEYKKIGEELGFIYVASGPLVRSSYLAGEYYFKNIKKA